MKHLAGVLLVLLTTSGLFAQQGTLTGIITKAADGQPLVGATVALKPGERATMTDENGRYSLSGLPYGEYTLVITSLETTAIEIAVTINQDRQQKDLAAPEADATVLRQVVVAGMTEKRAIETKGFAVSVIETGEASVRNLQTNELLDRTVGVRVRQSGGLGSEVEYNINGMTGRSIGLFIDGIEISTYGSSFNLNNIPPALIDRIEVYKGVLPSHLSGDLLGGAINIVLKKGAAANNLSAAISYGSFNTLQADFSGQYRNPKNGFTAKASGFFTDTDNNYKQWGKFSKYIEPNGVVVRNYRTKRFFDGYRTGGGRLELGFTDVNWADDLLIGYTFSDAYKEIQHGWTMGTPYMGRTAEAQAHVLSLNYGKQNLLAEGLSLKVHGVYSNRKTFITDTIPWAYNWDGQIRTDLNGKKIRRTDGAQQGKPTLADIDRQIANVRTNLSYDLVPGHRVSLNHVFYTVDRQDSDRLFPAGNSGLKSSNDLSKNVFSLSYEAQTFGNRLRTNLFAKIYQQSLRSLEYKASVVNGEAAISKDLRRDKRHGTGYGLAVSYSLRPDLFLITSAERAVRMPHDNEIFGNPDQNVLPSPGLDPEISDNYNLGFRWGIYPAGNHRWSFSGNVFWRNVKDRIMPKANELLNQQEIEQTQYMNLGLSQALGFEGEATYSYRDRLTVMLNFSKFNSLFKQKFDPETGQRMTYYNTQIPNEPFFTINGNVHYRLQHIFQKESELSLFYTLGYVHPFRTVWPESDWFVTPAQYVQHLGVSYRFPDRKLTASLDLKNLLNAEIYDNFGVQKPGRAIYLKVTYTLNNLFNK